MDKKPIQYKVHESDKKWLEEHTPMALLSKEEIDDIKKTYTHWEDIEDACIILLNSKMKEVNRLIEISKNK